MENLLRDERKSSTNGDQRRRGSPCAAFIFTAAFQCSPGRDRVLDDRGWLVNHGYLDHIPVCTCSFMAQVNKCKWIALPNPLSAGALFSELLVDRRLE